MKKIFSLSLLALSVLISCASIATSADIATIVDNISKAREDLQQAQRDYRALPDGCHWVGDPHQCDWFVQKRDSIKARENYARSRINAQIGLLRANLALSCLGNFEPQVVACSNLEPMAAAGCLIDLWANHRC